MILEYQGKTYLLQHFKSTNPEGKGLYVRDLKSDQTIFELFRNEDDQSVIFNALEFHADLGFVEQVIAVFDKEIGRKFETELSSVIKNPIL